MPKRSRVLSAETVRTLAAIIRERGRAFVYRHRDGVSDTTLHTAMAQRPVLFRSADRLERLVREFVSRETNVKAHGDETGPEECQTAH